MTFSSSFRSAFSPPFGGGAARVLFYDTFFDTNGVLLPAHVPNVDALGGGWLVFLSTNASINIQSNQANANHTGLPTYPAAIGVADVGQANVQLSMFWRPADGAASNGGLVGRFVDFANNWIFLGNDVTNTMAIRERVAGVNVDRVTAAVAIGTGVQSTLSATLDGNNLSFTCNGATISYTSSVHNTATKHGINLRVNLDKADDFEVRRLP